MNKQVNKQSGFTLTELSLSMAMLSVLLIIILLSIFNIVGMYNKGLTLKRVNQSGRAISAEVQVAYTKQVQQQMPSLQMSRFGQSS